MPPPNVSDMRQVEVECSVADRSRLDRELLCERTGHRTRWLQDNSILQCEPSRLRNGSVVEAQHSTLTATNWRQEDEHLALPIFITAERLLCRGTIKELECVLLEDAERGVRTTPTRTTTARAATNQIIAVAQMSAMRKHQKASNDSRRSFLQVHARYATSCDLPHYLASDFIVQSEKRNDSIKQTQSPRMTDYLIPEIPK
ncbi:hypothetical protein KCU99_g400, partial [Aureobasidium melanogenum]